MGDTDDPLTPLEELQRKIDALEPKEKTADDNPGAGYAKGMRMGIDLLAGVGVGCFIGYQIDKAVHTLPLFLIVFIIIGFAAGMRNILRNVDKV